MVRILTFVLVITLVIGLSNFAHATARTETSRIMSDSMSSVDKAITQFVEFTTGEARLGDVLSALEIARGELYVNMLSLRDVKADDSLDEETLINASTFVTGLYMLTDLMHMAIGTLNVEMLQTCTGMLIYLKDFVDEHNLKNFVRW